MDKKDNKAVVILTGAGISVESGLKTFRSKEGLWENYPIEDVATLNGYLANPDLVHKFYNQRRAQLRVVEPNAAHIALAEFSKQWRGNITVITQNIDNLHERAGQQDVIHIHGELNKAKCTKCDYIGRAPIKMSSKNLCPACPNGKLRPHVVWFGEIPLYLEDIYTILKHCDIFIAVGTSGNVYPAAGFVELARVNNAVCHEINTSNTHISERFHVHHIGTAVEKLGPLLTSILATDN